MKTAMNEISVMSIIDELLESRVEYTLDKLGGKVVVFEPLSDEYWKECVRLFLAAAVYYLRENHTSVNGLSYSDLCGFVKKAREIDGETLNNMFLCGDSECSRYYTAFLEKAKKCTSSVIIDAHMQLKKIDFDKERIAELEKIFEI